MNSQQKDRLTGLLGMIGSSIYVYQASLIEDSLLADAVGVTGVPTAIGVLLGTAAVFLFLKSWLPSKAPATPEAEEAPEPGGSDHPHLKALGLLAILLGFRFHSLHWCDGGDRGLFWRRAPVQNFNVVCLAHRPLAVVVV